jgi:excisionase family DNA binding protein
VNQRSDRGESLGVEDDEGSGSTDGDALLSLQEAADVVGVHYLTLYRKVRSGELPALLAGGRYRIRRSDLDLWLSARSARGGATATVPGRRDWPRHVDALLAALVEGTGEGARDLLTRLVENGADPIEVCERVIAPALREIGDRWARGEASVADEHRATAVIETTLGRLAPTFSRPGRRRGVAVVTTARGNRHTVPAAMVASALRADRFVVHYVGGDLPTPDLVDLAVREEARVAAISCSYSEDTEALAEAIAAFAAVDIPVIVGGAGVDGDVAERLGAFGYGATLQEAQRLAREALAARSG